MFLVVAMVFRWYFQSFPYRCREPDVTAKTVPVETFDLVIFGGTGDLALRKLLPGLFRRYADGQIPEDSRIIGVARDK